MPAMNATGTAISNSERLIISISFQYLQSTAMTRTFNPWAAASSHQLDLARPPLLRKERLKRAIEAQDHPTSRHHGRTYDVMLRRLTGSTQSLRVLTRV